jgi:hypothetical protein
MGAVAENAAATLMAAHMLLFLIIVHLAWLISAEHRERCKRVWPRFDQE